MKYTLVAIVLMFAQSAVSSPGGFNQKLSCIVSATSGQLNSFLPPVIGDTVTIDANRGSIQEIRFDSGNMVPILTALQRDQSSSVPSYIATFSGVQEDTQIEKITDVLMVGKFWDGTRDVYQGEIQVILLSKADGLSSIGHVKLNCQPAN